MLPSVLQVAITTAKPYDLASVSFWGAQAGLFNLVDLVNQLEHEKAAGRSGRLAESLQRHDLVVIDEFGYLPFSDAGGQLLFHLISKLSVPTSAIRPAAIRLRSVFCAQAGGSPLATTQAYANSFGGGGGGALPALAASRGGSMGSTAQRGGFGLNGIVGQGAAVPGQAPPVPGVASLSAQPTALAPDPVGFSSDPGAQPQQPSNQYAQIGNALKAAAAGQQKPGQKGGGMQLAQPGRPSPIGLQQARAMFDPARFYGMLREAGVGR